MMSIPSPETLTIVFNSSLVGFLVMAKTLLHSTINCFSFAGQDFTSKFSSKSSDILVILASDFKNVAFCQKDTRFINVLNYIL